jgi:hypothetical protein
VADVVGVPFLPPGRATPVVERVRAGVARLHRSLAPPPVQVLDGVFGILDSVALIALCRLDVPDHLDGPTDVATLARRVDADPDVVERLTRYGVARGWLGLDRHGRLRPNRTTAFLRRDHPGGWRAWIELHGGSEVLGALSGLALDPRTPDPFAAANGASFFDWQSQHPERHAVFDDAMSAGGRMHGLALAEAVDWSGHRRVCDVGGGSGALLRTLLGCHPHLHGVLLDLPPVVARAEPADRLEVVGGDAFASVPSGCDAYLLVNVVHDWDDDRVVALLATTARAADGGRLVVVEGERRAHPIDGIALRSDVLMMALAPGGRERTSAEIAVLAERAGLGVERVVPLASGDRAHLLR